MPSEKRTIFLKQSGEGFNGGNGSEERYTVEGIMSIAGSIAKVYHNRETLAIAGITVVLGGGNLLRGSDLKELDFKDVNEKVGEAIAAIADTSGRAAIAINATILGAALEALNVPVVMTLPHTINYWDSVSETEFSIYQPSKVKEDHTAGKVVIAAGGAGIDNCSSDFAAVYCAQPFAEIFDGPVLVLKRTKFDGIFDSDPAQNRNARPYRLISAQQMLLDYKNYEKSLDRPSLELLTDSDLQVHVFAEEHDLVEVVSHETTDPAKNSIGTIVVGHECKAIYH